MDSEVAVLLANGFEEIEAITVIDTLRRADIRVVTVSMTDTLMVMGGHAIEVKANACFHAIRSQKFRMIVLPGGGKGVENLGNTPGLREFLAGHSQEQIAAICAAPSLLARLGLLAGIKATVFPGFETVLEENKAHFVKDRVCVDKGITTSQGPGTALLFSYALVKILRSGKKAKELADSMLAPESI